MRQSERHNAMEALSICLLLTFILLGLMNPTDLSLVVRNENGGLDLPQDNVISIAAAVVRIYIEINVATTHLICQCTENDSI